MARKRAQAIYFLLVFLLIGISFWCGSARQYLNFQNPPQNIVQLQAVEVDYHMLYPAIESKKTFIDTFAWWHEPWRGDSWVAAYWRPLSMQTWWIESHVFGEKYSFNWMRVSLLLSAIFDLLFAAFLLKLTKSKKFAILGLAIFALPATWIHLISPLSGDSRIWNADLLLTQGWKDQADLFANCFVVAALIFTIDKGYAWTLLCAALSICFKESGLMSFPLMVFLIIYLRDVREVPKWALGGVAAILGLMMLGRWFAGPLVFRFHTYGGHHGVLIRYATAAFPKAWLETELIGSVVFALGLSGLAFWRPRSLLVALGALLSLFAVSVLTVCLQSHLPPDIGFAQFILRGLVPSLMLVCWLGLVAIVFANPTYRRVAIFLIACALITAVPYGWVALTLDHVLVLTKAFQSAYGACVVMSLVALAQRLYERRRHSSLGQPDESNSFANAG